MLEGILGSEAKKAVELKEVWKDEHIPGANRTYSWSHLIFV